MDTVASMGAARFEPTAAIAAPSRLLFIDNVRWVMIVFVLSMHAAVTYSPYGSWYYREHPPLGHAELFVLVTYQAVLQGFFMALLFFLAGYFVPSSYDRKGAVGFIAGRLVKLGLPTLLFVFVIGPLTEYFVAGSWHTKDSFAAAYTHYIVSFRFIAGTGPLWFCAALVIFSAGYAIWRLVIPSRAAVQRREPPSALGAAAAIAALAIATYLVRISMPVGAIYYNMQPCYFAQYIIMFGLGIAAYRGAWLERISTRFATVLAAVCLGTAAVIWVPLLVIGGGFAGNIAVYGGRGTWQSAGIAIWESMVCIGMSAAVLALFRAVAGGQGWFARAMSANAFAVYVIHPPLLVVIAFALTEIPLPPLAKIVVLWLLGTLLCFGIAAPLARRVPLVGRILSTT